MKWVIASVGLLVVIVVFSLAALDQKDVVWDGAVPHCPHCRTEVPRFAEVCTACQRAFDWQPEERVCDACLTDLDVDHLVRVRGEHPEAFRAKLVEAGASEEVLAQIEEYFGALKKGACAYCGGTGKWIAPGFEDGSSEGADPHLRTHLETEVKGICPVCFGEKSCRLCDGELRYEAGREDSHRALQDLLARLEFLNTPADARSCLARFREIRNFVRKYPGRGDMNALPEFDCPKSDHLGRARSRMKFLRELANGLVK